MRRAVLWGIALVLVASACNSRLLRPPAPIELDGAGATVSVTVDERTHRFSSVLTSFFPETVRLHAGDAVDFELLGTGEPHTVALGTLVDEAVTAIEALGPGAPLAEIEKLSAMKKIPALLPKDGSGVADPSAANRCILDDGVPEVGEACPAVDELPEFDGTHAFYSSGVLEEAEAFRVQLSADLPPGTYRFMSLFHRSEMTGTLEVVGPDDDRPLVAEVKQDAADERKKRAASLEAATKQAVEESGEFAFAGVGPARAGEGFVSAFIPQTIEIEQGDTVGWRVFGTHTISFEPPRKALDGLFLQEDGAWILNLAAWNAVEAPEPNVGMRRYPPSAKGGTVNMDGGEWDGEGTFHSGVLRAVSPRVINYTLRFTEPGTYGFRCVIHPPMRGTVVVT